MATTKTGSGSDGIHPINSLEMSGIESMLSLHKNLYIYISQPAPHQQPLSCARCLFPVLIQSTISCIREPVSDIYDVSMPISIRWVQYGITVSYESHTWVCWQGNNQLRLNNQSSRMPLKGANLAVPYVPCQHDHMEPIKVPCFHNLWDPYTANIGPIHCPRSRWQSTR